MTLGESSKIPSAKAETSRPLTAKIPAECETSEPLHVGHVHVWHVWVADHLHRQDQLRSLLSAEERAAADRFVFEKDRINFTIARGMRRILIQHYGVAPARDLQFSHSQHGKPSLATPHQSSRLHFNTSRTAGMVVLAFACDRWVGIDVEYSGRQVDADGLIQRFFSIQEQSEYFALPPQSRLPAFYRGWTRKEAYLKALGVGLSQPLNSFSVSLRTDEPTAAIRHEGVGDANTLLYDVTIASEFPTALVAQRTEQSCEISNRKLVSLGLDASPPRVSWNSNDYERY